MNSLLITEDENKHYVLIKDFNKFVYNQTNHKEKIIFVCTAFNVSVVKIF